MAQKRGIGFYSYGEIKNTKPVGHVAAILIGGICILVGAYIITRLILRLIDVRAAEVRAWGSAESHTVGFIFGVCFGLCFVVTGAFTAHAGVIYYFRKIWRGASKAHPNNSA